MNIGLYEILSVLGSLGLFLYGLKTMSDGLQRFIGRKMPMVLSAMTSNRLLGVFTGFLLTLVVQSSSATTVMVISFVNAGLLNLTQAIGVIMGANIGTTITAWLITFIGFQEKFAPLVVPAVAIGFVLIMVSNEKFKTLGSFSLGFAFLFLGLNFLRETLPGLVSHNEVFEWVESLTGNGFSSTMIFFGIGLILTLVLQSSSATMAITLVACFNGWIGFEFGAAMILGENIGTTITANLASLNGNLNSKRAALAHTLFNVIGVIWMLIVLNLFLGIIDWLMVHGGLPSPFVSPVIVPVGLAIFHSSFNIANTIFLFSFVKAFANGLERILPLRDKSMERIQLEYFQGSFLKAVELSVFQAMKETRRFSELAHRMFNFLPEMLNNKGKKEFVTLQERMLKYEQIIDKVDLEINSFLFGVSKSNLTGKAIEELNRIRQACSEIEKIGDICFKISLLIAQLKKEKIEFTAGQSDTLSRMFQLTNQAFDHVFEILEKGEQFAGESFSIAREIELRINVFRDEAAREIIGETQKGKVPARSAFYFSKLITACEKVGDNLYSIAEVMSGQKDK
ncbi:MAG TPA: Na/Pi cotransporter family protein [Bacteroidales bacterium]|nr:Na/Pi cotransporter family protein [Bacteroidales bacterium]